MWKLLKAINLKLPIKTSSFLRISIGCLVTTVLALPILTIFPTIVAAMPIDINAGVKAATDPLIKAINDHWGKVIVLVICGSAVIRESGLKFNKKTDKGSKK